MKAGFDPSKYPIGDPRHPNAVPRFQPSDECVLVRDREWCRNFPRICPFCGVVFYSWAPYPWPVDQTGQWHPGGLEPAPQETTGHRNTCGTQACIEAAQDEHFAVCQSAREDRKNRAAAERAARENDEKMAAVEAEKEKSKRSKF